MGLRKSPKSLESTDFLQNEGLLDMWGLASRPALVQLMEVQTQYSHDAALAIQAKFSKKPSLGMVLGSGLGAFAERVQNAVRIPYQDIPHFPTSSVKGHAGELVCGEMGGVVVAVMAGRVHFYEGYSMAEVAFPVRVLKALGCEKLFVTNASGGLNPGYAPGDFMVIEDIINFTGNNPLLGPNNDDFGPRFPDMSSVIDADGRAVLEAQAKALKQPLQRGVYCGVLGPSYETPAEVRMLHKLGGDAVGMSTVPEIIAARHSGLKTIGLSVITNKGAGLSDEPLDHADVKRVAEKCRAPLCDLLENTVKAWA